MDQTPPQAISTLVNDRDLLRPASEALRAAHIANDGTADLPQLRLLRGLLLPIFGTAAHSLIHRCAAQTDTLDGLIDALAAEFHDPALGASFGMAVRLALMAAPSARSQ